MVTLLTWIVNKLRCLLLVGNYLLLPAARFYLQNNRDIMLREAHMLRFSIQHHPHTHAHHLRARSCLLMHQTFFLMLFHPSCRSESLPNICVVFFHPNQNCFCCLTSRSTRIHGEKQRPQDMGYH